jgi:formylglycine-generating enzyme required for sulfatase activity
MKGHPTWADPGNNKSDDQLPIDKVSFNSADSFFVRLNKLTGKNYRRPTEAEWEYAARGGKYKIGTMYSGSNDGHEFGWFNNKGKSSIVGQKKPNALGIYDMTGNVFELCSDWYHTQGYVSAATQNPTGPNSSDANGRVIRGGYYNSTDIGARVASRSLVAPTYGGAHVGFRVVLPAQ